MLNLLPGIVITLGISLSGWLVWPGRLTAGRRSRSTLVERAPSKPVYQMLLPSLMVWKLVVQERSIKEARYAH
jgi:hypothetical protein